MPYTPELDESAICTLRRHAWLANMPMSKVLEAAVIHYSIRANKESACETCKDKSKCAICYFNRQQLKKKLKSMQAPKSKSGGKRPAR
jgi:hypothetical protein